MRKYISNEYVHAVRELCENLKGLADHSPEWNHLTVYGYFFESPDYLRTPYACIVVIGSILPCQLEKLVSDCNPTRHRYYTGYDHALRPAYSDKELMESIVIATGDCSNIEMHNILESISTNMAETP